MVCTYGLMKTWHFYKKSSKLLQLRMFHFRKVQMFYAHCWQKEIRFVPFIFAIQGWLFCQMQTGSKLNTQSTVAWEQKEKEDSGTWKYGNAAKVYFTLSLFIKCIDITVTETAGVFQNTGTRFIERSFCVVVAWLDRCQF